jgi:hypothetical protein
MDGSGAPVVTGYGVTGTLAHGIQPRLLNRAVGGTTYTDVNPTGNYYYFRSLEFDL